MSNPEKYHFRPENMLREIITIFLNFAPVRLNWNLIKSNTFELQAHVFFRRSLFQLQGSYWECVKWFMPVLLQRPYLSPSVLQHQAFANAVAASGFYQEAMFTKVIYVRRTRDRSSSWTFNLFWISSQTIKFPTLCALFPHTLTIVRRRKILSEKLQEQWKELSVSIKSSNTYKCLLSLFYFF